MELQQNCESHSGGDSNLGIFFVTNQVLDSFESQSKFNRIKLWMVLSHLLPIFTQSDVASSLLSTEDSCNIRSKWLLIEIKGKKHRKFK